MENVEKEIRRIFHQEVIDRHSEDEAHSENSVMTTPRDPLSLDSPSAASGFRPSTEKDGHDAAHDQGAVSYYREGVGSKRRLIQDSPKPVAHYKSFETDGGAAPHRTDRLALVGNQEQINQLLRLQVFHPDAENEVHSESSGVLWQGPHDRQRVGSSASIKAPRPARKVRPNKRLKVNQPIQATINQVIQTPTIPDTNPKNSHSWSDPVNQSAKKQQDKYWKGEKTQFFSGGPHMSDFQYRVKQALLLQPSSAKEEFRSFTEKLDQQHKAMKDLYQTWQISDSTKMYMEALGGLEMIVSRIDVVGKQGEVHLWNSRIRPPLPSRNLQAQKYDRILQRINKILHELECYHNVYFLSGIDQEILGRDEKTHAKLLEWFYEQLFIDTDDHPPLLGNAIVGGTRVKLNKVFTDGQKRLYTPLDFGTELNSQNASKVLSPL
ncbi:hypothetical protein PTTG_27894 [Puccinia triticina 1-1 BBBD Race 1]|uniref:Uncharacterized protein n=1 Tax=Puccinia triticina (isolate 1-1 / race 1 (BBBD)) TaxID=630390 RepID=A0A180GH28_PUCT1|nr:hypothetical protein PTTG_27894 [Puccinia triticina 1-1 BBBD Race 1]